jgi:signal transduction histidine kinase
MERDVRCCYTRAILEHLAANGQLPSPEHLQQLGPELAAMKDPHGHLQDTDNRVSTDIVKKLFSHAVRRLKDSQAPYHIGRRAAQRSCFDYLQRLLLDSLASTEAAIRELPRIPCLQDPTHRLEVVEVSANGALLRVHWTSWMNLSRHFCLFFQGFLAHLPRYWKESPLAFTEHCCHFHGDRFCEYRIRWRPKSLLQRLFSASRSRGILLERIHREEERERHHRRMQFDDSHRLNRELQLKMRQLIAIHETGKAILTVLDLTELLSSIMKILASVCHIRRAAILWVNEKENTLDHLFAAGFDREILDKLGDYRVALKRQDHLLVRVVSSGRSFLISDSCSPLFGDAHTPPSVSTFSSLAGVPLQTQNRVMGVLATEARGPNGISAETFETLELFAPQIAIAIRNATLYHQQQQQMAELNQSRALLCRAEKLSFLGDLSARLAHEIKNPLTAIGTFLQMLPARMEEPEFRDEFYGIAVEETARINRLVAEMLDLVKPVDPLYQPTDLHDILERMMLLVSPQSRGKNIDLRSDFDPSIQTVNTDPGKLKQVVLNILTNAVEFAPINGNVSVRTLRRAADTADAEICIEISDSGPGVAAEDAEKIFDPYYTTKTRSRISGGTGLGLFIAAKNMEDLGGVVRLGPASPKRGAVFAIVFPEKFRPKGRADRVSTFRVPDSGLRASG